MAAANAPAPPPAAPTTTSPVRALVWIALAVVIAIGVVMFFRHQESVAPLLGVTNGAAAAAPVTGR